MIRLASYELIAIAILACALSGCEVKPSRGTVHGNVTLDDTPLAVGLIRFLPVDGQTSTADAIINDGEYSASVPPGDKQVVISATKVVGKKRVYNTPDSPEIDLTEELLPTRYNSQTELKMTVAAGSQQQDFQLKSAP